jgi:hypothetical protein
MPVFINHTQSEKKEREPAKKKEISAMKQKLNLLRQNLDVIMETIKPHVTIELLPPPPKSAYNSDNEESPEDIEATNLEVVDILDMPILTRQTNFMSFHEALNIVNTEIETIEKNKDEMVSIMTELLPTTLPSRPENPHHPQNNPQPASS